ncbi:Cobalt/magnesium transport protein CorA [Paraconexibacter sp. AEG42_29]|uniref:Cobalt/magnesium transport protein CorA n=1 Tax=Paraconexibacter sp. AEG42_29 TaxID=2997339 RepID=A0AAU7AQU6_9ACTN
MIVDQAVYCDGLRHGRPATCADVRALARDRGGTAWVGLHRPSEAEFAEVAEVFGLHELAVRAAVTGHQRAKLQRFGDTWFCVLRPARYHDDLEVVEFGELHVFAGPDFVVTVRHAGMPKVARVRRSLEDRPDLLQRGPVAILHALMDRVVEDYAPVVVGLQTDIDEIEDEVFSGNPDVSRRIYELIRETVAFQRATLPLTGMLERLIADDRIELDERRYLRDVLDHARGVSEQTNAFRQLLQSILDVNLTIETKALSEASVAQNEETKRLAEISIAQNEEVKKISAWAAILFAPTFVGTIYGMNFEHMPELSWKFGYPMAIAMMLATGAVLFAIFRRRTWI